MSTKRVRRRTLTTDTDTLADVASSRRLRTLLAEQLSLDRVPRLRQQLSLLPGQVCCRLVVHRVPPFPGRCSGVGR
jgi:hypothetical protein